jgi:hypothetical protein
LTIKQRVRQLWQEGHRDRWAIYEAVRAEFPHRLAGWNYVQNLCRQEEEATNARSVQNERVETSR